MQAMTIVLALLFQQPGLPQELNVSQIVTPGGAVATVAAPGVQNPAAIGQQLPAVQLELEQDTGTNPFDVLVSAGDLRQLLTALAQANGLSLVLDPEIGGTVDADLRGVTMEEALAVILDPRGLEYQIEANLLRVNAPQMESRTFEFDYITTERSLSRSLSASASAGGASFGGSTGASAQLGGGGGGGSSSTSISGTESTSLLEDVQQDLLTLTSPTGSVVYNRLAGLIFATDFRENLDAIGNYLELIQNAVHRQVVIEARIIEVKLNDNFRAGVDWSAILGNTGNIAQTAGGAASGALNFSVSHGGFEALIQTLSTRGEVNVLSAASISTLNNQPAVFRVGTQDVFFITTNEVDPDTGQVIRSSTQPATINEGVVLDVTPQISSDGIISMNIHPTITERTGQATSPDGNTVPIVDVRETDTVLRVVAGDTIFIAGLISDRTLENATKVPILGDLPLVGGIFRGVERETRKSDMVILLTPTITTIRTAADYARERLDDQENLRETLD